MSDDQDVIRILYIVDDEDDFLGIREMAAQASSRRCQLTWIAPNQSYREYLGSHEFQIVLVGYTGGWSGDGFEIVREIAQLFPGLPVIVISSWGQEELPLQARRAGAAAFYSLNSLNAASLGQTLEQALGSCV